MNVQSASVVFVRKSIAVFMTISFLFSFARSMLSPVLALYLQDLDVPVVAIGFLISIQAYLPILLSIPCGQLADQIGHRIMILVGTVSLVISGLLFILSSVTSMTLVLFVLAQVVSGVAQMMVWISVQTLAVMPSEQGDMNTRIGWFSAMMAVGQSIAPLVGGIIIDTLGYNFNFLLYGGIGLLLGILVFWLPNPQRHKKKNEVQEKDSFGGTAKQAWKFWKTSYADSFVLLQKPGLPLILLLTFFANFIVNQQHIYYPVLLEEAGLRATTIGVMLSASTVGILLIRFFTGFLLHHFRAAPTMIFSLVLSIGGVFLTPLFVDSNGALLIAAFVAGLGIGLSQPLQLSMIADHTPAEERGLAMGMRIITNRISQVVGPPVFGGIAQIMGLSFTFYFVGAALVSGLTGISLRMRTIK